MNDIDVTVILVNYNSSHLLINAIQSVIKNTQNASYEIIVVDNASPDKGIEKIKELYSQEVKIIESKQNIGFGRANNLAIPQAKGDYLFFLNPDTILLNDAISILLHAIKKEPLWGTVGGMLFDEQGRQNHSAGSFPSPREIIRTYTGGHKEEHINPSVITDVDFVSGADMMIPRHIIDDVGAFDKDFFMYCEETDLQKRIADAGYKRIVVPTARILHLEGGSYQKQKNRSSIRRLQQDKSYCLYVKKHYHIATYLAFRLVFFIIRIPAAINPHYKFKDNLSFLKMLFT